MATVTVPICPLCNAEVHSESDAPRFNQQPDGSWVGETPMGRAQRQEAILEEHFATEHAMGVYEAVSALLRERVEPLLRGRLGPVTFREPLEVLEDALYALYHDVSATGQYDDARAALRDLEARLEKLTEYEEQVNEILARDDVREYWFTIGKTCSLGEAFSEALARLERAERIEAALMPFADIGAELHEEMVEDFLISWRRGKPPLTLSPDDFRRAVAALALPVETAGSNPASERQSS